ncbi:MULTISPECIES: Nif11 family protein [unclassified Prochlorococcus]|uniref:Nif11 family protein n=1 Tax=unclassified Prochlorococcus TaxID=2627481 RepID=UPI000533A0AA|nr:MULTISPECIES: Nif11 family protein [unclassified Prochlorococcus]KGG16379.1 hypothetical protein EV07_1549 [Prochlorococcus sp. MIT 0603]KGG17887.1 hypothetical protein EV06_0009 [Prochlorococcus sp. MIT 0602]
MSRKDLNKFIEKVNALNALIDSIEKIPSRKIQLEKCISHDQVVKLAKSWGFDIGRRWGE